MEKGVKKKDRLWNFSALQEYEIRQWQFLAPIFSTTTETMILERLQYPSLQKAMPLIWRTLVFSLDTRFIVLMSEIRCGQ
jgi:hypothetical protein